MRLQWRSEPVSRQIGKVTCIVTYPDRIALLRWMEMDMDMDMYRSDYYTLTKKEKSKS